MENGPYAMTDTRTEPTTVTTPTRARGAVTGHNVSTVLVLSTLAVVIIFGGLLLYYFV